METHVKSTNRYNENATKMTRNISVQTRTSLIYSVFSIVDRISYINTFFIYFSTSYDAVVLPHHSNQ